MANYLRTTDEIKDFLMRVDPKFTPIIGQVGDINLHLITDRFSALVSSVVGQQLSGKVADIIWQRLEELLEGEVVPQKIQSIDKEKFRSIGISYRKIEYIKGIAEAVITSEIDLEEPDTLTDKEVIDRLVKLRGIGTWTAEMFLIFSLGRKDVFSTGDLGLKKAVIKMYDLDENVKNDEIERISSTWSPYRTFASLYLWRFFSS